MEEIDIKLDIDRETNRENIKEQIRIEKYSEVGLLYFLKNGPFTASFSLFFIFSTNS